MYQDSFETERLKIRPLSNTDVDLILRLNSNPKVMEFIGDIDESVENAQNYVTMRVEGYADKPGLGIFVAELKSTNEPIGWFCLKNLDDTDEIEIGYRLLPQYWGKGYATEGAQYLVDFGFKTLGLREIVGVTLPANKASQVVLEKVGLEYVGMAHYYGFDLCYFKRSIVN